MIPLLAIPVAEVQELPEAAGIGVANWNWKVVRQFLLERCCETLSSIPGTRQMHIPPWLQFRGRISDIKEGT